mgnify:FL=1
MEGLTNVTALLSIGDDEDTSESFVPPCDEDLVSSSDEGDNQNAAASPVTHIDFSPYIFKVLKQVHPDTGISRQTMGIVNS